MGTEERTVELNVISATDLKKVRNFGQDVCYAVAYIRARDKKATAVDKEGGNNPIWNSKLVLTCDESLLHIGAGTITVEIYSHGSFSNKLVGTSKISLVDIGKLLNQTRPPSSMSFEVRRPSGKVRGTLTVSVKFGEKRAIRKNAQVTYSPASAVHPSTSAIHGVDSSHAAGSVYPPPKASSTSISGYGAGLAPPSQVYPPPKPSSSSTISYGANVANAGQVYPPPMVSAGSHSCSLKVEEPATAYPPRTSGASGGPSSKVEEPVMAYPAPGYGAYQYPPKQYGSQYPDNQQYYPPAQANVPYNYQQAYYSKPQRPPRRQGGGGNGKSGMGMGLLGGVLGGLLLGDMSDDIGGL